jgi:hypothetical protein
MPSLADLAGRPDLLALAGGGVLLVGLGTALPLLAVAGAATMLVGLKRAHGRRASVARLTASLRAAVEPATDQAVAFGRLVDALQQTWPLDYAAFVEWSDDGTGGTVVLGRGRPPVPETAVVSWLLLEAESGAEIVIDRGDELRGVGWAVAIPLRRQNSALIGFVVLCASRGPAAHVIPALEACLDPLGPAFAEARKPVVLRRPRKVLPLHPRRRRQARTLEA